MRFLTNLFFVLTITLLGIACGGRTTTPHRGPPGENKSAKTKELEAGAALLQTRAPLEAMTTYVDGFHFTNGSKSSQMEAHHYCGKVNEDFTHVESGADAWRAGQVMQLQLLAQPREREARLPGRQTKAAAAQR